MSTLTQRLFEKQKKYNWFSNLSLPERTMLIIKYRMQHRELLNKDVVFIYDNEFK